jgi:hypothetical protein
MTDDDFILAARNGDLWAVETFLAEGGDMEARSSWGQGALVARDPQLFNYLLQRGADPFADYFPLATQVWEVCPKNVETLLALGVSAAGGPAPAYDPPEGPLHMAVSRSDQQPERLRIVQALIRHGANPNRQAKVGVASNCFLKDVQVVGETPLHRAAAYCDAEIVEALLAAGGDTALRDARGESAQSWASRHWREPAFIDRLAPQLN